MKMADESGITIQYLIGQIEVLCEINAGLNNLVQDMAVQLGDQNAQIKAYEEQIEILSEHLQRFSDEASRREH